MTDFLEPSDKTILIKKNKVSKSLRILNEVEFFNKMCACEKFCKQSMVKKECNQLLKKIAKFFGNICTDELDERNYKYYSSGIDSGYIESLLKQIYTSPSGVHSNQEDYENNLYRMWVLYDTRARRNKEDWLKSVVNVLIYKQGCPKMAKQYKISNKRIMQFTVICQNQEYTQKLGTGSMYVHLTNRFLTTCKTNHYKYVILEVASSGIEDEKSRYGNGASLHLMCRYAKYFGFREDPKISTKYYCFDPMYKFNTMILDLDKYPLKHPSYDDLEKICETNNQWEKRTHALVAELTELTGKLEALQGNESSYKKIHELAGDTQRYQRLFPSRRKQKGGAAKKKSKVAAKKYKKKSISKKKSIVLYMKQECPYSILAYTTLLRKFGGKNIEKKIITSEQIAPIREKLGQKFSNTKGNTVPFAVINNQVFLGSNEEIQKKYRLT